MFAAHRRTRRQSSLPPPSSVTRECYAHPASRSSSNCCRHDACVHDGRVRDGIRCFRELGNQTGNLGGMPSSSWACESHSTWRRGRRHATQLRCLSNEFDRCHSYFHFRIHGSRVFFCQALSLVCSCCNSSWCWGSLAMLLTSCGSSSRLYSSCRWRWM